MTTLSDIKPHAWVGKFQDEECLTWDKPDILDDPEPTPLYTMSQVMDILTIHMDSDK